jgi:hypothetical protein
MAPWCRALARRTPPRGQFSRIFSLDSAARGRLIPFAELNLKIGPLAPGHLSHSQELG